MKNDTIDKILLQLISKTDKGIIDWKLFRPYDNTDLRKEKITEIINEINHKVSSSDKEEEISIFKKFMNKLF